MTPTPRTTAANVVLFCCVVLAACTSDEPRQCAAGETLCAGACVQLDRSAQNCGVCGNTCSDGQFCSAGACTCPEGLTTCGEGQAAVCVDATNDPANCGACGTACQDPFTCIGGQCRCPLGLSLCDERCVSLNRDPNNCGACGKACAPPLTCVFGTCRCAPGSSVCADLCVPLDTSENCGECGVFCPEGYRCKPQNGPYRSECSPEGSTTQQPPDSQFFELGAFPTETAVADLDSDGTRDLLVMAVPQPYLPVIYWLRGTGAGRLAAPSLLWTAGQETAMQGHKELSFAHLRPSSQAPQVIASADDRCILFPDGVLAATPPLVLGSRCLPIDVDGDGVEEIATKQGIASLLEDGTLSAFTKPACWGPPELAADFNGDGSTDVLSGYHTLLNQGDGSFSWGWFPRLDYYQGISAELDGNGPPELILSGYHHTVVLRSTITKFEVMHEFWNLGFVTAGDLDGDGRTELVSSEKYIILDRAGQFSQRLRAPWFSDDAVVDLDLQDVDGDGRSEVLLFTETGLRVYLPQASSSTWPLP